MPDEQGSIPRCDHGVPLGGGCLECSGHAHDKAIAEQERPPQDDISFKDVLEAQQIMWGAVERTRMVDIGDGVLLKMENQHAQVNAFKIRGAYNRLQREPAEEVVTAAVGSHGFAVGEVCSKVGKKAKCFMPKNAPPEKIAKMREILGEDNVVLAGEEFKETEEAALKYAQEQKLPFIHPYNDRHVVAGQGVIGLEVAEDLEGIQDKDVTVYVPTAGGGMLSGIAIALRKRMPNARIIGVQPEAMHAMQTSVAAGAITAVERGKSLAEPLVVNLNPRAITFKHVQKHADGFILVTEEEIRQAMRDIYEKTGQKVEGAGAIAYAAAQKDPARREKSVCIVSGGNISEDRFKTITAVETISPLSLDEITRMSEEELMRSGRLDTISDVTMDELPEDLQHKIDLVRGLVKNEKDNGRCEVPRSPIKLIFYPDKETVLGKGKQVATFFVEKIIPAPSSEDAARFGFPQSDGEYAMADAEIAIVVTAYMECAYGTCGVAERKSVTAQFPGKKILSQGLGSLHKTKEGGLEVRWGSFLTASQMPNEHDTDYFGPYPSKFADWIRQQILEKVGR